MSIPETLRVHLATDPSESGYYRLDPERFENAGKAFPDAFRRLRPTYSDDEAGFVRGVRDADVLIGWKFPRPGLAERAPKLRWVQLIGAGVDHLYPLDWLPAGVKLITASGVHTKKSFEYVLMGLIALHTRLPRLAAHQRARTWKKIQTGTLPGKTALVIGLGAVGTGAAEAARTLGMRVLGVRRTARRHRFVDELFRPEELPAALPRADYVVLAAPLTSDTKEILGERELALLARGGGDREPGPGPADRPDGARSRSPERTARGRLPRRGVAGTASPGEHALGRPNLFITPHVGADDIENYIPVVFSIALDNLARFFAGRRLRNVVNRRRGY